VGSFVAINGSGAAPENPLTAPIADVSKLDGGSGLACGSLPAESLRNHVALILRGTCNFEVKLNNAQRAGAVAALVYATEASPTPIGMSVGLASLPAQMVSHADGLAIQQNLAANGSAFATMRFLLGPVTNGVIRRAGFSSAGPNVDLGLKPELMAIGSSVYTATQTLDQRGDMYSADGFIQVNGTSFSAPLVAGAAALLKSARPGLTVDQYRSLLINTAGTADDVTVQQSGAGILDMTAALQSSVTAFPAVLGLGAGGADPDLRRTVTITNVGTAPETYFLTAASTTPGAPAAPALSANTVELGPGGSAEVAVQFQGASLPAGAYEGFLLIQSTSTGATARVPYWYAVRSDRAAAITILNSVSQGRRGSSQRDAFLFRVTDAAGVPLNNVAPDVTVVSGGGSVRRLVSYDNEIPGLFGIDVQLGLTAGPNVFRIQAGDIVTEISIQGQ